MSKKITTRLLLNLLAIFLLINAVPFSYLDFGGVRILLVLVFGSFLCIFLGGGGVRLTCESLLFWLLLGYCFLVSSFSASYSVFGAAIIFYWLAYWPLHIKKSILNSIDEKKIVDFFIFSGIFCALGVFFQVWLFESKGLEFGKIDLDGGNRRAFGFLWTDYSFLSLFLVSLVPLLFWSGDRSIIKNVFFAFILIIASVLTTARTGFMSLGGAIVCFVLIIIGRSLVVGTISRKLWFATIALILLLPVLFVLLLERFPRFKSLDDSGRFEGIMVAINFLRDNLFFGAGFDLSYYKNEIDVIPHNVFFYIAICGGIAFFVLFVLWGLAITSRLVKMKDGLLLLSFMTSLVGFQLVPSFFSAYYFSFFLSICLIISLKKIALQ